MPETPGTPSSMFLRTPGLHVPQTPPATPASTFLSASLGTPGLRVPQTPVAAFGRWEAPGPFELQTPLPEEQQPCEDPCDDTRSPGVAGSGMDTFEEACSHSGMPEHARYCMHCGEPLQRPRSRTRSPDVHGKLRKNWGSLDLEIVGFRLPPGAECEDYDGSEPLWDHFRSCLLRGRAEAVEVKEEIDETGDVQTVPIEAVGNLQQWCSSRFRDGRTLEETTSQLKRGRINELEHHNFVLNVAKACVDGNVYYWSLDHRRLLCLRQAGKQHVRVKVCLSGRRFDEFARKDFGRLRHDEHIQVRGRRR